MLKSSKHLDDAQKLVNYLTGKQGQQALVDSSALEYPVGIGVAGQSDAEAAVRARPATVDIATLNGPQVVTMMQQAGLL